MDTTDVPLLTLSRMARRLRVTVGWLPPKRTPAMCRVCRRELGICSPRKRSSVC